MNSRPRAIQNIITSALYECPHVSTVEPLGSLLSGSDDEYSDIDLRVHVTALPEAIASRHELLSAVGSLAVEWTVHLRPDSFCSSLLFAEESCYHRADLEFCSTEHVSEDELLKAALSCNPQDALYVPAPGEPGHFLVGQLLGGTRYAKARRRGQHLACWRFFSAMVDWYCALLYEQSQDWPELNRKLNTEEYLALDGIIDAATVHRIHAALDLSRADKMDSGVLFLLDSIVELAVRKADSAGRPIPDAPISHLSDFLRSELGQRNNVQQGVEGDAANRAP